MSLNLRSSVWQLSFLTLILIVGILFSAAIKSSETTIDQQTPRTVVSDTELFQGETLFVRVDGVPEERVSGTIGSDTLYFFSLGDTDSFVALYGIDVTKQPGVYSVYIQANDRVATSGIEVIEKDFPTTHFVVTDKLAQKGYSQKSIVDSLARSEIPDIKEIVSFNTPRKFFTAPFVYPLDSIVNAGAFGSVREESGSAFRHLGVDLDAAIGTPAYAINNGTVVFADYYRTYGNTIIIDHGLGIYSLYLHLKSFEVKKGSDVARGEVIGYTGESGYAIEPHLHFSIKANGASVDPLYFIKQTQEVMKI